MQIWRLKKVMEHTGLCRTAIYNGIKAKTFPQQIPLGARSVGWLASEIEAWVQAHADQRC